MLLAARATSLCATLEQRAECQAVICDISPEMLDVGKRRVLEAELDSRISCVEGNAEALPFANGSFDAYTIAFGIRNVTHIDKALAEALSRAETRRAISLS